jgi:WD domain, G-beta repeat
VLSPDAVASDICSKEVEFAASLNKRFAPIVCRQVDTRAVPEALRRLNFIFCDDQTRFDESMAQLVEALETDIEWVRKHTEFGEHAGRWVNAGRPGPRGLLLRSPTLEEAERWIAARPANAPAPTEATQAFIAESRRAATRRRNVVTALLTGGLLIALSIAAMAYWQRGIAIEQRGIAEQNEIRANEQRDAALITQSRFLIAAADQSMENGDASGAVLLSLEALPDARAATPRPYVPKAEDALFNSFGRVHELLVLSRIQSTFSADSKHIVTTSESENGIARLWNMKSGKQIRVLRGDGGEMWNVAFSPDSKRVAAAERNTVRLWDVESGQEIATLRGHQKEVQIVAFSPDGKRILTESKDRTARLWNVESGRQIQVIELLGSIRAAFSADGKRMATAFRDATAQLWDLES